MEYSPSVAHDTPPDMAREPFYFCANPQCKQLDLDVYDLTPVVPHAHCGWLVGC